MSPDDRAAAAELELQAFSYIVSHDLAASFRHVSEFSRLLIGDLGEGLTERQRSHADRIRVATSKCQLMLDQLLLFSNLQQRAMEPVRQDATTAMRAAMMRMGLSQAESAAIAVEPLGEAFADEKMLGLIFHHLLENAIKFRRPDVVARVRVEASHDDRSWRMRVTDNGQGVAPSDRGKAFQMFQRLSGESAGAGIGAGLAICRRIARRHGGELAFVDSTEGTCIELALPSAPAPA